MPRDRLDLVQAFFQEYFNGEVEEAVKLLEPTVEYHVPGAGDPAGHFVGREAVANHLERFLELAQPPVDVLKWDDWLIGSTHVAGVVRFVLQRPGRVQDFRVVFLVEVSSNMKIQRVDGFISDPEALDRFFSW